MEYQEQLYSDWRSSAAKVFWGIVLASIFSVFCNFYDMVSWIGSLMEMAYEHSQTGETSIYHSKFFWIGVGGKMIIITGYVLYLLGLTQFAQIQQKESTAHYVYKARTSVILLIITSVISLGFGFISYIPFIGIFFVIIIWLMYVITYFIMKHAYDGMMMADDFGGRAKLGAKNVRYAAVCQLRLLFMPLVILLVAVLYVLMAGASIYGMREELAKMAVHSYSSLENGAMMFLFPAIIMVIVAIICAIIWAFCAFIWPMMGWYRIMSDGPADVMIIVQQEETTDYSVTEDSSPMTEKNDSLTSGPEMSLSVSNLPSSEYNIEMKRNPNRKWYYIGGEVLAAILIGILSVFLFKGCNTSDNLLNVQKPSWEKFIMVTSDNVTLYKEASTTSPKLMLAVENVEEGKCDYQFRWEDQGKKRGYTISDYLIHEKCVMPVVEDAGDWYKVQVDYAGAGVTEAYINKRWCKEVTPQPITEDIIERIEKEGQKIGYVIKNGKTKGLCFSAYYEDIDYEIMEVGQLFDGILIFPQHDAIILNFESSVDLNFSKNDDNSSYTLTYGEKRLLDNGGVSKEFDTSTLTDTESEEIYNSVKTGNPVSFKAMYYFPEADRDRLISFTYSTKPADTLVNEENDQPEEGVKNYSVKEEKGEQQLMAELDEELVFTGVENEQISIVHEEDFEGDGYNEVLISESCGDEHGCIPEVYIVYYDKDKKEFKQTNRCESYVYPEIEIWNGKTSFVQRYGLRKDRYIYENCKLNQVERVIQHVGQTLNKWTRAELFDESEEGEKEFSVDIDGDGINEKLIFGHNESFACGNGRDMFIAKIKWEDGRTLGDEYFGLQSAPTFSLLETMTNGMCDLLLDEAYLFRWNGTTYEEWEWNENKLVRKK